MSGLTRSDTHKSAITYLKTCVVLFLPILGISLIRPTASVQRNKHKIVFFSDRGVSRLAVRALELHGFVVSVHSQPIRPAHLDPRWEKVFVLRKELTNPGSLETVTWLDDDLFPDMHWLRRLITNKYYVPVYAGFDYGRKGPRHSSVMSNLMVFRTGPEARELVKKWADVHTRYLNKTTGVQDQDGLNEIIRCNVPPLACITHSFSAVHTSGNSGVRVQVLNRAAQEHLWRHQRVVPKLFAFSIFVVLLLRTVEHSRMPRCTALVYKTLDLLAGQSEIVLGMMVLLWLVLQSIPSLNDIGRYPDLNCNGPSKVKRLGESSLALAGRWMVAHGALVYADWMNRYEVTCLKGVFGRAQQRVIIWAMENKASLLEMFGMVCSIGAGGFIGACIRVRNCRMLPSWRDCNDLRKQDV